MTPTGPVAAANLLAELVAAPADTSRATRTAREGPARRAARRVTRARGRRNRARPGTPPYPRVQRFHGGVKIGLHRVAHPFGEQPPSRLDVGALSPCRPARSEFELAPVGLVVDVSEPVLVHGDAASGQLARASRGRAPAGSPPRRAAGRARSKRSSSARRRSSRQPASSSRKNTAPPRAPRRALAATGSSHRTISRGKRRTFTQDVHGRGRRAGRRLRAHGLSRASRRRSSRARSIASSRPASGAAVRHQAGRGARARPAPSRSSTRSRAQPHYLPDTTSLTAPLHRWRPRAPEAVRAGAAAHRRAAGPRGLARALAHGARARRCATAARRSPDRGRSTSRSSCRPSRSPTGCSTRPTSATCTPTSRTGRRPSRGSRRRSPGCRSRSPATRATSTRAQLNPHGWLRRKLLRRALRRHLHRGERRAPAGDRARGRRVHLVYHGLNADFARLLRATRRRRRRANGTLRVLGVGRLVAKKGFDMLVEACAVLRRRGVAVRGADRRPGRQARRRRPRSGSPRSASSDRVAPAGPDGPGRAARASTAARARCACRAACSTTTATGSRTCSSRRWRPACRSSPRGVSGHPRARRARGQRAARRARRPGGARRRAAAPARATASSRARLGDAGRATVASASTATRLARPARRGCSQEARRVTRAIAPRPVFCVIAHEHRDRDGRRRRRAPAASRTPARRVDARHRARLARAPTCRPTRSGGSSG